MKKMVELQARAKAPKNQGSSQIRYKYRTLEDMTEAIKPILQELELYLVISDEIVLVGSKHYVKATATIFDGDESVSATAYARESDIAKGMSDGQLTGATSSYARKYALGGLLAIDNSDDLDVEASKGNIQESTEDKVIDHTKVLALTMLAQQKGVPIGEIERGYKKKIEQLTMTEFMKSVANLEKRPDKGVENVTEQTN